MVPAFLPPPGGAPRGSTPGPRGGSRAGFVIAVVLAIAGMLLPWLRPHADRHLPDAGSTGDAAMVAPGEPLARRAR